MLESILLTSALSAIGLADSHLAARIQDGFRLVEGSIRFSQDGSKCVYVVAKDDKLHPVVGETVGSGYEHVSWPSIDASGKHTVFLVRERDPKKKIASHSVLYDGKVLATDGWIGPVALDPNGVPAFWIARGYTDVSDGHVDPGPPCLVWGKYKSPKWQFVDRRSPPEFSLTGRVLVTTAARGNGDWNVVSVDEKGKDAKHGSGSIFEASLQPDGHTVAYTFAHLNGEKVWMLLPQQFLVQTVSLDQHGDNKSMLEVLGGSYDSAGSPVWSANGLHVGYKAMKASKMGVAVDDQEDAVCAYDFVDDLALRPDGSDIAFVARNHCKLDANNGREVLREAQATGGEWFVVHGTVRLGPYESARSLAWPPRGKALAYAAKVDGKWHVFVGSKKGEACDEVGSLTWSEDGDQLGYGCLQGTELWWRVVDHS